MVLAAAVLLWLLVVPALAAAVPDSVTDALPPETASRLEGLDECADHNAWTEGLSRLWEEVRQYLGAALREKASGAALLLGVVLVYLINHTKIGMAMRAVSVDFETAQLMGIKINSVISATFIIGTFLAAVGSVLFFTNFPGVVPTSGAMPGLKAFVAAVFGGIGSVPGAVVGAFIIGICESVIKGLDTILMANGAITEQVGFATFSDAFTFVLLIVILVFKPTGLFGEKTTDKV